MRARSKRGETATATGKSAGTTTLDWEALRPEVTPELLSRIARRIANAFHPEKVILFGSHAYGKPHLYSDVDLFVIMESNEPIFSRIRRVSEVARVDFLPMDIIVRTPAEVEERLRMGDHFVREVLDRGEVLYDRAGLVDREG